MQRVHLSTSPFRAGHRAAWLLVGLVLLGACHAGLAGPPAQAGGELVSLGVPGFGPAVVSVPAGSLGPKPLLVVAHGAWDRPEWHCELWQRIVGERGFVLCLRGRRVDDRVPFEQAAFYYPDHHWLGRALTAAISALEARYGSRLDARRAAYAGFSQGAIMGALVLGDKPTDLTVALLIEGGAGEWNVARAKRYRRRGGDRVLLMCGTIGCRRQALRATRYLERGGVTARVEYFPDAGHSFGGGVEAALPRALDWLVAGDPRWR
jgi:predicted esterase